MHQVGDDEADDVGAAGNKSAGRKIWTIVKFLNALQHARLCLLTDVGVIAEGFGDCDNADAEVSGDVF